MALFNNPKKAVYGIAAFLALLILALATKCHAEGRSVIFSGGKTLVRGETQAMDIAINIPNQVGDIGFQYGLTLIGDSLYGTTPERGNIGLRFQIVDGFGPVELGLGPQFLQHTDGFNGANLNFCLSVTYHWKHLNLRYQHWSNAGTQPPNVGRDMVLLGYRFY